ncbi:MAG: hypothetical protein HC802_11200 [Caldilineaceae bacterium]|nr:hypothetical protein [Caldilineaceae bacterium]
MLLDEPTNHLDIQAQEILQEVLEKFSGTILLVSHDRYLIDRLATQIWELRGNHMHIFPGAYSELVAAREKERVAVKEEAQARRTNGSSDLRADRELQKEERRRTRALAEMEEKIHRLERDMAQLEHDLAAASQAQDFDQIQRLSNAYAKTQQTLERSMESWAELAG